MVHDRLTTAPAPTKAEVATPRSTVHRDPIVTIDGRVLGYTVTIRLEQHPDAAPLHPRAHEAILHEQHLALDLASLVADRDVHVPAVGPMLDGFVPDAAVRRQARRRPPAGLRAAGGRRAARGRAAQPRRRPRPAGLRRHSPAGPAPAPSALGHDRPGDPRAAARRRGRGRARGGCRGARHRGRRRRRPGGLPRRRRRRAARLGRRTGEGRRGEGGAQGACAPASSSASWPCTCCTRTTSTWARSRDLIDTDPVMTLRVLHLVNSGAFSLFSRVDTVQHAVVLLGVARGDRADRGVWRSTLGRVRWTAFG